MLKTANEKNLKEKLEYLNLNLENLPKFIMEYNPLEFRVQNGAEEGTQVVYKHIPINKIQILITPTTKNADLRTKYSESLPIHRYLNMENSEEADKYAIFLNMLASMDIDTINEIEEKQSSLDKGIPFKVKYDKSYLWQIYYSRVSDTYFMLVPIEDMEYNHMFYLLKKQIEFENSKKKVPPKIYVPISCLEISRELLNKSEIRDIENYLWLLTAEWVNVYEVFDKKYGCSLHIIGEAKVYDNIKTQYKIKLANKQEATDCYKLLKALFILKTELNQFYKFDIRINKDSILEFYYDLEKLTLETLPIFIKKEYKRFSDELVRKNLISNQLEKVLAKMKIDCLNKEKEFLDKEKEITMFLECKKTFFGKIKIFFKGKKKEVAETQSEEKQIEVENTDVLEQIIQKKPNYTIEDLVIIYSIYDKKLKHIKDLEMDIEALEHKIKNLERKIDNASLYISEIERHKKSIFEFWRFANKDALPALMEGEVKFSGKKLNKFFEYEFDFDELGNKLDKLQRDNLTKEEMNSIFLARTNVLLGINLSRKEELDNAEEKTLKKLLADLKQELQDDSTGEVDFDIFGSILEDRTQIKIIANKHHREIEKNKLQILGISKDTTLEEFLEILKKHDTNIKSAMDKVKFMYNMPVYKVMPAEELPTESLAVFSINELNSVVGNSSKEINLYKLNLNEGQNALFYTNIIFFDNNNNTLPLGMNLSNEVLIDIENINLKLMGKYAFMTNLYAENDDDDAKLKVINVNVFEYKVDEEN